MKHAYHTTIEKLAEFDSLAIDRTILANERTFLAYIRTAMTLFIGGISFISFFDQHLIKVLGWLALLPAVIILVKGFINYRKLEKALSH